MGSMSPWTTDTTVGAFVQGRSSIELADRSLAGGILEFTAVGVVLDGSVMQKTVHDAEIGKDLNPGISGRLHKRPMRAVEISVA